MLHLVSPFGGPKLSGLSRNRVRVTGPLNPPVGLGPGLRWQGALCGTICAWQPLKTAERVQLVPIYCRYIYLFPVELPTNCPYIADMSQMGGGGGDGKEVWETGEWDSTRCGLKNMTPPARSCH